MLVHPSNVSFHWFFLCLAAVSQHAVCSSELHHGEGGEHPAVQPLAPTHPHLTPDPTGPESDPGPGADLHPDRNSWTEIQNAALDWTDTPLCQDSNQTENRRGRREEAWNKKAKQWIQNWFWLYLICLHFLGFQSFKAVLLLYKKRWSVAIIKKREKTKKYNKGLFVYCCKTASSRHFDSVSLPRSEWSLNTAELLDSKSGCWSSSLVSFYCLWGLLCLHLSTGRRSVTCIHQVLLSQVLPRGKRIFNLKKQMKYDWRSKARLLQHVYFTTATFSAVGFQTCVCRVGSEHISKCSLKKCCTKYSIFLELGM